MQRPAAAFPFAGQRASQSTLAELIRVSADGRRPRRWRIIRCMSMRSLLVLAVSALAACAASPVDDARAARDAAVIASPLRTPADRVLDAERKPAQFLPFTGVAPGMKVLDVSAGGGLRIYRRERIRNPYVFSSVSQ